VFFGVQVGGITISLAAILVAAGIFVVGLLATRGAQRWLDDRFLPSTRMDVGLRNSVRTIFGYLGFVVAAMIGFAFLGVDLSSLAIVAGALSVGIGFGLQSIVQNFVSGLILLAERPIKAGDWIVVGDSEGYVKRINVRATEIETFDKAILIVPNASLVSGTVKNWMHNDLFGRTKVKLGVPHGTDPERVRAILVAIARAHPLVTSDPEPRASLVDLNESALHFELAFTVVNVDKSAGVRSDVRFEIVKRLAAEGIAIK
jgi:small-conductance mechanosensitive channel